MYEYGHIPNILSKITHIEHENVLSVWSFVVVQQGTWRRLWCKIGSIALKPHSSMLLCHSVDIFTLIE